MLPRQTLSHQMHCLLISKGYPPDRRSCIAVHTHAVHGHVKAKGIVCSWCTPKSCPVTLSAAAQYINSQTCTCSHPPKMGKVTSRMWLCVCVCPLQTVLPEPSPSSSNSLAFNGLCRALQPNHRPVSFGLTEYNMDSGGKWHLWTCCLTTAKMSGWTGLLVVRFLLFASFIRCV